MNVRPRFFAYALPAVLVIVMGWVGLNTWQELRALHRSFGSLQAEDFYLPAHVETAVRELNDTILLIDLHHDPADRTAFDRLAAELQQWITDHQNVLTTTEQRGMMRQIAAAFRVYQDQSRALFAELKPGAKSPAAASLVNHVEANAAPVLELCEKLKESERAEQTQFIRESHRALTWIQELLIAVLLILIAIIVTGIVTLYTGFIGPLQVELTKSRALAVRNEKLASLGTLAAGVAHEIRNPLTAINVRLHSLKRGLAAHSSEQEDALVIGHEIQRLELIVQEFLQFARPAEPKFVVVSADRLFTRVQSLFGSELEKNSIQLKVESLPDVWVQVDPHQFEQVLINLVKNAAESMDRGGTITLRLRTRPARLRGRMQPAVVIEVCDTGKGIAPEIQKQIFDPFFSTKEEGTGLGLVIASRIIEKHHGTLECHSELNHGSTFTILLPQTWPEEIHESTT